jgi:archaellum component FlaC
MSFLDLLSGALGAVLILFIIIPKITTEQQAALEQIDQLNVQVEQLSELMEQVRNSVPTEVFEQIQSRMEAMQNTIAELTNEVQRMQQRVSELERENSQLREQQEQSRAQLQQLREQLEQARQQLEEARQQQQQQQQNNSQGEKIFGINAELGIVCAWPENIDVDLYVKNLETNEICYFSQTATAFGNLQEDVRSRRSQEDDRYELFYQSRIVPGQYQIFVGIYEKANLDHARTATVNGYAIMFPGKSNQKKIPFGQTVLTVPGQNIKVGTLTVKNNNINLNLNE